MSRLKEYLFITLIISVLLGILLPLVMGLNDPTVLALSFVFVWCISSILLFIMVCFLEGIRSRREWKARRTGSSPPPGFIREWEAFYKIVTRGGDKEESQ